MEDDDEFGDLYTDVLRPFASTSSSTDAPQPHGASPAPPPLLHPPIDLSLKSDENEILFGNPRSNSPAPNRPSDQTLAPRPTELDSAPNLIVRDERVDDLAGRSGVSDGGRVELPERAPPEDVKFDIEEGNTGIFDAGSEPIIPGLSGAPAANPEASTADNDWDSDSEDDLQIVLNDSNHGPMAMERGAIGGEEEDDDDDEDGDPLVIVADGELNQELEAQEWGEDAAGQAVGADGERKETGEAGKVGGGGGGAAGVVAPKIGYSSHGYHPFHSQFKYVRPGAAPMPGATTSVPGGAPGPVRPLVNMGPIAGRGRGDWRPTGIKNAPPMQKGFHSGFGLPGWGNNVTGRSFGGGLEFTLPSHK